MSTMDDHDSGNPPDGKTPPPGDGPYTGATRRLSPDAVRVIDRRTPQGQVCPKCGSDMEPGWVPEFVTPRVIRLPLWVAGRPRRTWLSGYRVGDARRHLIVTLRCLACGYLESYAP